MIVIASEAKQSRGTSGALRHSGSPRRCAPRDDHGPRLSDFIRASGHQRRANRPDIWPQPTSPFETSKNRLPTAASGVSAPRDYDFIQRPSW